MKGAADYAVVYDITCNRERGRVDKVLKGYGFRVQKSVFECKLKRGEKDELIRRLKELKIETGFVKVYRLEYSSKRPVIGKAPTGGIDGGSAFVI